MGAKHISNPAEHYYPDLNSGCWLWAGALTPLGYGHLTLARYGERFAHRISYAAHHGPIPKGLFVLHRCDTPACIRPDHLFLGTQTDNMADMDAKGRRAPFRPLRGYDNPRSKLTAEDHAALKRGRQDGLKDSDLAKRFEVAPSTIARALREMLGNRPRQTECINGHPFAPDRAPRATCKICHRDRERRRRQRLSAA